MVPQLLLLRLQLRLQLLVLLVLRLQLRVGLRLLQRSRLRTGKRAAAAAQPLQVNLAPQRAQVKGTAARLLRLCRWCVPSRPARLRL